MLCLPIQLNWILIKDLHTFLYTTHVHQLCTKVVDNNGTDNIFLHYATGGQLLLLPNRGVGVKTNTL